MAGEGKAWAVVGDGPTKMAAEQAAAQRALRKLQLKAKREPMCGKNVPAGLAEKHL
jgi:hypothetical protein